MAYEQILSQYANINNVGTLWAQIVANFIHAAPAAKGDILFWNAASQGGAGNTPTQPSHLTIGSAGDFLSVNNGVPVWTAFGTPSLAFSDTTTNAPKLAITIQGKTSTPVALPVADATHSGIITTGAQTIAGAKTFKETVHSEKDVEADGGVSAYGIADLSMGGGGGTGTVIGITYGDVTLQTTYTPVDGIVTLPKSADNITWTSTNQSLTQTQKTNLLALYAKAPNALWIGENELADKNFVNSSITTATATFRGTVTATDDTDAAAATALATISTKDDNDYAFVKVENTPQTGVDKFKRYKYNGSAWVYEYTLNNSSFTSDQWSAINSGITSSLVSDIGTLKSRFTGDAANNALQLEGHSASYFATAASLGNYLLLTGGTLDAKDVYPLYLDNTASGATDVGMKLKVGGAAKGALLYGSSSWGTALLNIAAGNYAIGVKDDGTPYFGTSSNKYKLWHENNDGSGSGLDADLLDGQHASYFAVKEDTENAVNTLASAVGGISAIAYDNKNKIEAVNDDVIEIFGYFDGSSARHALSSDKLTNTSKIGDTNQPVYFTAQGVPVAIDYTIGRNVAAGEDVTAYTQGDSIDITNHVVKVSMTASDSPSASGNSISFIDTISQNTAGKISATKKTIYTASSTQLGLVKVGTSLAISNGVLNIGTGGVTNAMLAGSIANDKLANSKVTIAGTDVSLGGSITAEQLQTNLGLGGAAYKAADYYVSSITWDSTNRKLQQSKGGAAATNIVQFGTAAFKAYTDSSSASAISSTGTDLVTERDVYYGLPTINNAHNYTSNSTFYAPTAGGTAGNVLIGDGTTSAPIWTNKIFVDTTNNRVGINTTSPSQTLSVAGTAGITGNTTIGGTLDVTGVATFNSNVRLPYTSTVKIKDSGDTYRDILAFNSNNRLVFGMGTAQAGYDTFIGGKNVVIQTGTTPTTEGTFSTSGLSIVHDITSTTGDIQALAGGVAAYGIADLAMGGGGGTGTVIAIKFEGSSTQYNPVDGIITLPAYPSLIGYATQNWVSSQITALNLGTASTHAHSDYLTDITWDSTNRILKKTHGGDESATTLVTFGSVYSHAHSEYLTALGVDGDNLSYTKGSGSAVALTVPYATTALDAKTESQSGQEFAFRQTGGGTLTRPYSSGVLKRVLGNTVVWNQLLVNGNFVSTSGWSTSAASLSVANNEATITANGTSKYANINTAFPVKNSHYYYMGLSIKGSANNKVDMSVGEYAGGGASQEINYGSNYSRIGVIVRPTTASSNLLYLRMNKGEVNNAIAYVKNFICIDLTLFFNGNIPTGLTAETFERDYGYLLANPEYNAGTLINNACSGLESVGFNLWDEEWRNDGWYGSNGVFTSNSTYLSSRNKIPIIAGFTYYHKWPKNGYIFYYDANGLFISREAPSTDNTSFNPPSNACYIHFSLYYSGGASSYDNNICINFSNSAKNGQYEPYRKNTLPLHLNSFRVKDANGNISTINGLKKAGTVQDEIVGKRFIQRVGSVDLGTCAWSMLATSTFATVSILNPQGVVGTTTNAVCSKYEVYPTMYDNAAASGTDKVMRGYSSSRGFVVKDTTYTSAAAFKTAMSGVIANYELATPIEYEIIDDFPTSYPIDVLGTEGIPEGEMVAPFVADIQYGAKQNDFAWDIDHLASKVADMDISHYSSLSDSTKDAHVITIGGKKLYLKFRATQADATTNPQTLPAFELAVADNAEGQNEQVFAFGTITEDWITTNCVLPS